MANGELVARMDERLKGYEHRLVAVEKDVEGLMAAKPFPSPSPKPEPSSHLGALLSRIPDRIVIWIALGIAAATQGASGLEMLSNLVKGMK